MPDPPCYTEGQSKQHIERYARLPFMKRGRRVGSYQENYKHFLSALSL